MGKLPRSDCTSGTFFELSETTPSFEALAQLVMSWLEKAEW